MDCICCNIDPNRLNLIDSNNYMLVEFLDDDVQKMSKFIRIIKQNNSTKYRSIYVGRVVKHPDICYSGELQFPLDSLIDNKTIIAYNPMSIKVDSEWEEKHYHIIRVEDIYCILEDWVKDEVI